MQSNNIESHNNLGIIYKETGNLEGAIESYNNAIEINPNNKEPYFNLGIAYKEIGNLENSIKIL